MKITTYLKNNTFGVLYTVELPDCEQLSNIVYLSNLLEKKSTKFSCYQYLVQVGRRFYPSDFKGF